MIYSDVIEPLRSCESSCWILGHCACGRARALSSKLGEIERRWRRGEMSIAEATIEQRRVAREAGLP